MAVAEDSRWWRVYFIYLINQEKRGLQGTEQEMRMLLFSGTRKWMHV